MRVKRERSNGREDREGKTHLTPTTEAPLATWPWGGKLLMNRRRIQKKTNNKDKPKFDTIS